MRLVMTLLVSDEAELVEPNPTTTSTAGLTSWS